MLTSLLNALLGVFGKGVFSGISNDLKEAYEAKLKAQTDADVLRANVKIEELKARQSILLAEQSRAMTSWIRPMIALPVVIYLWKLIVWDTILQWGVTPNPGEFINWVVLTVIGAYFLTRPFEK